MIADFPTDLLSFLQTENQRAFDPSLNEKRKIANEFYRGEPFGDEVDGRSQLVTRDVAEVVDYMTVAIMRTMVSDKVVEFEARSAEQQEAAKDATELVAWQFMREQAGITIIRDALIAGLIEKTGVLKTWAEPTEDVADDLALVTQLDDPAIIAAEPLPDQYDADPATGEVVQVYQVRRRVKGQPRFRDAAVPNEEFGFSPDARSLDDADYIVHRTRHTLLAIMAMFGIDEEAARSLGGGYGDAQGLSDTRDAARGYKDSDDGAIGFARKVWIEEEYVRWDYNGDGHPERLKVHRVGSKVLHVEPIEEQPFVIWSPFPQAHRIVGDSLADKTMDIQRVRSMLLRQAMDALYFANAPRSLINTDNMDENTIDDILSIVPGAPIRWRGATPPTPWTMPFAAPHAFSALEFMTGERESRTGITRHNQGMNPDTLNKTASGMAMLAQQGAQMEEYVARNFAECLAELFEKKLRLMRKFGLAAQVRVGGQFRDVDASTFEGEMDIGIRVGLGTGRKDQRIAYRMQVLEMQKQARDVGLPIVDDEKLFNNADAIVADMGLGDGNQFFIDPKTAPPKEPPKDPAMVEAEGRLQLEQQRQQFEQQKTGAQLELERMKADAQADIARERALLDAQLMQDKAALEADLAERKFQFEQQLAERRMLAELAMRGDQAMPQNRPGGDLDK